MNKLQLEDVSYTYSRGTPFERVALDHVSIGFAPGRITGLIGHTGSGKSTLVNLLNGLYRPDTGRVLLDGEDIWERQKEIGRIRYRVGLVMQYPEYQLFDETVRADIGFAPRNQGLSPEQVEERVREAAAFTGIGTDMLDRSPFDLSGGQKRRVAIAGILAMRPEVLVLDEPAAGLDPRGRREILGGLSRYVRESGTTLILVSHSMEDMAYYCDDVAVMDHGRLHTAGTVASVFSEAEQLESIGLDIPAVAKVAAELIRRGIPLTGTLYTVEGVRQAILSIRRNSR